MRGKRERGMIAGLLSLGMLLAGLGAAQAADQGTLVRMKAGDCKFTVLDARGVTPLQNMDLALTSPVDGSAILAGKTDTSGTCTLAVPAGRYVVRVRDMDLAILETAVDQTIVECRIVLPEQPLAVGGQEAPATEGEGTAEGANWTAGGMKAFVVGTAVVLAVGGAGYLIYDELDDDDDDDTVVTPPAEPTPTPARRSSRSRPPSVSN